MLLNRHNGGGARPRKILYAAAAVFIAITLLFAPARQGAFAFAPIDTERDASLAVTFAPGSKKASNIAFKLYRAAEVSIDCRFTLSEKFSKYPLSLTGLDSEGWRALAQTMAGYVTADSIAYDAEVKTGSDGTALFSALKPGLYLVIGAAFSSGSYTYTPSPFLVCLPDYEDGAWNYNVGTEVKYETKYHGGGTVVTTLTRKVLKAWKNDDKDNRPASVSVTLLKNGAAYDTVTLTADNNWRYTWTGLSKNADWQLVENKAPDGYTVTVTKEGVTFLVTNTYGDKDNPPDDDKDNPPDDDKDNPPDDDKDNLPDDDKDNPPDDDKDNPPDDDKDNPPDDDKDNPPDDDKDNPPGDDKDNPPDSDKDNPPDDDRDNPPDSDTDNPPDSDRDNTPDTPDDSTLPNIPRLPDEPDNPPDNSDEPGDPGGNEKLPQTGLMWWPIPFFAIIGMILFTAGWVKQKKDGDGDEK